MNFDLQPQHLRNKVVQLVPLHTSDFDQLFNVASDPLIWQQHPNPNRYQLQVFKTYFDSAMASKGAFKIINVFNNNVIGCTRFMTLTTSINLSK